MKKLHLYILLISFLCFNGKSFGQSSFNQTLVATDTAVHFKLINVSMSDASCGIEDIGGCDGNGSVFFEILALDPSYDATFITFNGVVYDADTTTKVNAAGLCNNQSYTGLIQANVLGFTRTIFMTVNLAGSPSMTITEAISNETCLNQGDGSINLNITGGTKFGDGSYNIVWDHGPTDTLVTGLSLGDYGYLITDSAGCQGSDTLSIASGDTITASFTNGVGCENDTLVFTDGSFSSNGVLNHSWVFPDGTPAVSVSSGPVDVIFSSGGIKSVQLIVDNGAGCSDDTTISVTVNSAPAVSLPNFNDTCANAEAFVLSGGTPLGGTYSGIGINSGTGEFDPAITGTGTHTIYYDFTDGGTGCSARDSASITINAVPTATLGAIPDICENAAPYTLIEGGPIGGIYTGTSVSGGQFDPSGLSGATQIIYTITNASGCTDSDTNTLSVNAAPSTSLTGIPDFCENDVVHSLTEGIPAAPGTGTYSGVGVTGSNFDPSVPAIGTTTIYYNYDDGSCSAIDSQQVTINAIPNSTLIGVPDFCQNEGIYTLTEGTPTAPGTGTYFGTGVVGTTFNPATPTPGNTTIYYTYDNGTCAATDSQQVSIIAIPTLNIPNDTLLCLFDTITFSASGATNYVWSDLGVGALFHSATNISTADIEATTTTDVQVIGTTLGCSDTANFEIDVLTPPIVSPKGDTSICFGDTIQLQAATGLTSYLWSPNTEISATNIENPLAFPSVTR